MLPGSTTYDAPLYTNVQGPGVKCCWRIYRVMATTNIKWILSPVGIGGRALKDGAINYSESVWYLSVSSEDMHTDTPHF